MSDNAFEIKVIARIRTDLTSKFGIPRQSGLVEELEGLIVFEPEYRAAEALRGIEEWSHLWLIWQFSENAGEWSPTVRPPRLGCTTMLIPCFAAWLRWRCSTSARCSMMVASCGKLRGSWPKPLSLSMPPTPYMSIPSLPRVSNGSCPQADKWWFS